MFREVIETITSGVKDWSIYDDVESPRKRLSCYAILEKLLLPD
jgi:hypothetical protein